MPRPGVGDVIEVPLPDGRYAYGRVLKDASIAFYREVGDSPGRPPIGSRDFQFVVGVYDDAVASWLVVDRDPSVQSEDDWPPPTKVRDVITGELRIYQKGTTRPSSEEECRNLETAGVWDKQAIVDRLMGHTRDN